MTHDAVRSARRQVEQRARRQIQRAPAAAARTARVEIRWRAWRDPWADRHRASSFELDPEGVERAVVVQPHAVATLALDEKQERRVVRARAEQSFPQRHHQARDARQDLMRLGDIHGGAARQRRRQASWIARAVVATLEHHVKRHARSRERQRAGEAGREGAPAAVTRPEQGDPATQNAPPESAHGRVALEPGR